MERPRARAAHPTHHVSIPERVWGGLERKVIDGVEEFSVVSIPERVWGGLERMGQ